MRLASLMLLAFLAGCGNTQLRQKPSPYRYTTSAPLFALGAHGKDPQ